MKTFPLLDFPILLFKPSNLDVFQLMLVEIVLYQIILGNFSKKTPKVGLVRKILCEMLVKASIQMSSNARVMQNCCYLLKCQRLEFGLKEIFKKVSTL